MKEASFPAVALDSVICIGSGASRQGCTTTEVPFASLDRCFAHPALRRQLHWKPRVLFRTVRPWQLQVAARWRVCGLGKHWATSGRRCRSNKHPSYGGLDANSVRISKTVHALVNTKCEGKALSLVSLVPRRFGLEAWRVLKEGI